MNEVKKPEKIFLDVRHLSEWEAGHVAGAVHFPIEQLQAGSLPELNRQADISTYCRSGGRAGRARLILENQGFTHVQNGGGLLDLVQAGEKLCTCNARMCTGTTIQD